MTYEDFTAHGSGLHFNLRRPDGAVEPQRYCGILCESKDDAAHIRCRQFAALRCLYVYQYEFDEPVRNGHAYCLQC